MSEADEERYFAAHPVRNVWAQAQAEIAARADPATLAAFDRMVASGEIVAPATIEPGEHSGPDFLPIDWPSFWARERVTGEWLVEPLLPARRQVAIYSTPKAGKSLILLEASAALACGKPILHSPPRDPLDVIYIDMENTEDDLEERLSEMGYGPGVDLSHLHYYLLAGLPPLDSHEGGEAVMELVDRHRATLVVVDTMARVVRGEENDADTYRAFYWHTGRPLKAEGVTLARLDHAGKSPEAGQRGSSEKAGDVDVVFRLAFSPKDSIVTLRRTHSRVPWVPEEIRLTRADEPLRHSIEAQTWHGGTTECARDLDELGVALDASKRTATEALARAGKGRRPGVVLDALKWRRLEDARTHDELSTGPRPGGGTHDVNGSHSGNHSPMSFQHTKLGTTGNRYGEPPREPLGTTSPATGNHRGGLEDPPGSPAPPEAYDPDQPF